MLAQLTLLPQGLDFDELLDIAPAIVLAGLLLLVIFGLRSLATRSIDDTARRYKIRKVITYAGAVLVVVLLLGTISSRAAQLSVAIGAIGAATIFALQEVIASVAGWIALSFGSFYKPGDRVQLGGIKGDVIDIGILRTTIMEIGAWVHGDLYSGRIVRVANSFVFKQPVFNYSAEFPFLWDEIAVPVRFGSDIGMVREIALEAAQREVGGYTELSQSSWQQVTKKFMIEEARLEPVVTIRLAENWIECTLRYIVDYKRRRSTRDAITCSILSAIGESGGAVRLASQTMEIVGFPRQDGDEGTDRS